MTDDKAPRSADRSSGAASVEHSRPNRGLKSWDLTRRIMGHVETYSASGDGKRSPAGLYIGEAPNADLPSVSSLRVAVDRGVDYLLGQQRADGRWEEYALPVGPSDAWVTAYVGLSLAGLARRPGREDAMRAASRAAGWLVSRRPFPAGWGYNDLSGPDADSTAYVLMLLAATGNQPEERDIEWLLRHLQEEGGFATYLQSDAWGQAHPDVTPTAFTALPPDRRAALSPRVLDYVEQMRRSDGTWPAYWWRACHYSTYWNLRLLRDLGHVPSAAPPVVTLQETRTIHTPFDLAFLTGIAQMRLGVSSLTLALAGELVRSQVDDGRWPGGASLRLTAPSCRDPWNASLGRGRLYVDTEGFITTASAVHVLSAILDQGATSPPSTSTAGTGSP
jgi:squalene cyclase